MKLKWIDTSGKELLRFKAEFKSHAPADANFLLEILSTRGSDRWDISIELEAFGLQELLLMDLVLMISELSGPIQIMTIAERMLAEWFGYIMRDKEKFDSLQEVEHERED